MHEKENVRDPLCKAKIKINELVKFPTSNGHVADSDELKYMYL